PAIQQVRVHDFVEPQILDVVKLTAQTAAAMRDQVRMFAAPLESRRSTGARPRIGDQLDTLLVAQAHPLAQAGEAVVRVPLPRPPVVGGGIQIRPTARLPTERLL